MNTSDRFRLRWVAVGLMVLCMSVAFQVQAHGGISEGFEAGVMPPAHWKHIPYNTSYTWQMDSHNAYVGQYSVHCPGHYNQSEWLVSPYLTNPDAVIFYSLGSLYWCRDDNDNCDLEVWLIKGVGVNDGDDVLLGKADDDWVAGNYAASYFYPPNDPGTRSRIAFRYVGNNGSYVYLDSITLFEKKELRVDFGGSGLWHFDRVGDWHRLSPSNAEWMGEYGNKLVADFGALGLYTYDGYNWLKISTGNANNSGNTMVAYNNGLVVDFGASGLWYYDADGSWRRISTANAEWLEVVYGNKLVADFGAYGMYEFDGATWVRITTGNADNSGNTMVGVGSGVFIDFGASGLYQYNVDTSTWTLLSPANVQWFAYGTGGLYADFGASGFYRFDGAWTKLSTGDADNSGNTMVGVGLGMVVDFGASGLYHYNDSHDTWYHLSPSNPQWLVYNYNDSLYVDFGTLGFYQTPDFLNWTKISTGNADNSGNTMIDW